MANASEFWAKVTELFLVVASAFIALGSEFWSALVGAVVGGMIAYFIQRQEREASRKDREEDRLEQKKAHAYSLLFKVMAIHTSLAQLKKHVDGRLEFGRQVEAQSISSFLLPIANLPSPVEFSASEMGLLLSLKDDDVFNLVASLDRIHNSILPAWHLYAAKRAVVLPQADEHTFDARDGKSEFAYRRGGPLEVAMYEAETLAKELVSRSKSDFAEAEVAIERLMPLLNKRLHLGLKLESTAWAQEARDVPATT